MTIRQLLLYLIALFFINVSYGQVKKQAFQPAIKRLPVSCDCANPTNIKLTKSTTYGITAPPEGLGIKKDISININNKYYFDEEHHTAWYSFVMPFDGDLIFEIIPEQIEDDYDFMFFKYTDSTFCDQLKKKKLKPVRSNISRNRKELKSITGLSMEATDELIHEGVGPSFSKYVSVKKGERYILILDNVYDKGKGHTIQFSYKKLIDISGIVLGDDSLPMKAEITLTDGQGNEVSKTESDEKTGKYEMHPYLTESQNYSLTNYSDSSFLQTKVINTNKKENLTSLKTILPKLRGGKKYVLGNINFYGNLDIMIPSSAPSVFALYKLMKKNKNMVIRIEGHTNGCSGGKVFVQKLSESRAKAIADSLIAKGIENERVSIIGFNCQHMLFPNPKNEFEEEQNRRVEINVISIK